ncbi:DUF2062 domain-containing protein [Novosphingobium sp. ES2-1]|uniref:DUF2062 domain-containing protein n=1 Tax=Novosphingobium TaxID=165696 RepID=UPI00351CA9FD
MYYAAFRVGNHFLGSSGGTGAMPAAVNDLSTSMLSMVMGTTLPIIAGLLLFATVSAAVGFGAVHLAWRPPLARQWRSRLLLRQADHQSRNDA